MSRFDFWKAVERFRDAASPKAYFRDRSPAQIRAFLGGLLRQMRRANRWDLWAIGAITRGFLSPSFLPAFVGWLVLQGRDYFEAVLLEPSRAADRLSPEGPATRFDALGEATRAAHEAYEKRTKRNLPRPRRDWEPAPRGTPWNWRQLRRLHPELWDAFFVRRDRRAVRPDFRKLNDYDLLWRAAGPVRNWADIYSDPSYLREQYTHLNPSQRLLHSVLWMMNEADNGGIDQFFWNSTGVVAPEALIGLELLGADDYVRYLKRVMAAFPGGAPDPRVQVRRRQIRRRWRSGEETIDRRFPGRSLKTNLEKALAAYIRKHPDDFFRPSR